MTINNLWIDRLIRFRCVCVCCAFWPFIHSSHFFVAAGVTVIEPDVDLICSAILSRNEIERISKAALNRAGRCKIGIVHSSSLSHDAYQYRMTQKLAKMNFIADLFRSYTNIYNEIIVY